MDAYNMTVTLESLSNISRTIVLPEGISFKRLHEIICILFNLDEKFKYKFLFEDIGLIIKDTGSLNRDNIDSRYELIDDYFQRYSEIKYINSFYVIIIKITKTTTNVNYPLFVGFEGKFNPSSDVDSIDDFINALTDVNGVNESLLKKIDILKIRELLLLLFNIHYTIENNEIIILSKEETLENYF